MKIVHLIHNNDSLFYISWARLFWEQLEVLFLSVSKRGVTNFLYHHFFFFFRIEQVGLYFLVRISSELTAVLTNYIYNFCSVCQANSRIVSSVRPPSEFLPIYHSFMTIFPSNLALYNLVSRQSVVK
jgi:hypothetical protein